MPIFQVTKDASMRLPDASFGREGILERKDLQCLLKQNTAALDETGTLRLYGFALRAVETPVP